MQHARRSIACWLPVFICFVATPVSRASPGAEPLEYPGASEPQTSDGAASSAIVGLGALLIGGAVIGIYTRREDRMRVRASQETHLPIEAHRCVQRPADCAKEAGALEGIPLVG